MIKLLSKDKKEEWNYISTKLEGFYKAYRKIVVILKGEKDSKIKLKLDGNTIKTIETGNTKNNNIEDPKLNGKLQKIEWYISDINLTDDEPMNFYIFAEPGLKGSNKVFEFYDIYLSK